MLTLQIPSKKLLTVGVAGEKGKAKVKAKADGDDGNVALGGSVAEPESETQAPPVVTPMIEATTMELRLLVLCFSLAPGTCKVFSCSFIVCTCWRTRFVHLHLRFLAFQGRCVPRMSKERA